MNTTHIVLVGGPVASMTFAAQRACAVPELPLAIIGGFAVTCRLGHVHRATGDVDGVADELATVGAEGSSAQALVERGIAQSDPGGRDHRVFIDGTKLEIIETQALNDDVDDIESAPDRLFVLGHRWALDSAELLRITVAGTDVDVTLPVATPAALVATKLHAFCDRSRDEKRASDAYDIFRLIESYDREGDVVAALNDGPHGLAEVVRELAAEQLVENAERVIRYLKVYGEPVWSEISAADIRRVLGSLVDRLRN